MEFKILDLFSGAGGLSEGLDMVNGFKTVVASDFNKAALETFHENFPNSYVIPGNITDSNIKNTIVRRSKQAKVNMIVGGPPCQGFSNKGKKLGLKDPRNFLFLEYLDIVKKIKPELFIIENVKTILTAANGYFLDEIDKEIKNIGYTVNHKVLTASDYGVPQNRQRAIIVAMKNETFNFDLNKVDKKTTVRDAISDLSYLNSGEGQFEQNYIKNADSDYQRLMRSNSFKLFNHKATDHSEIALEKLSLIPPEKGKEYLPKEMLGKQKFKTTWGRLVWDEQSPTIDTRFDTPSNGKNSHPYLNRAITPREAARIQSFPDDFHFVGKKTQITKQIGNAVPPLMAKAIAEAIKRQVADK